MDPWVFLQTHWASSNSSTNPCCDRWSGFEFERELKGRDVQRIIKPVYSSNSTATRAALRLYAVVFFFFFFYLLCHIIFGCAQGGMAVATATAVSLPGSATMTHLSGELQRAEANFPRLQVPRTHFLQTRCLWKTATFRSSNSKETHHKVPFAYGKENVNEDTDDMFDELFNKYGKVVFRRNDKRPPSVEVDDDAESLSFAVAMAKVASEVKAADIKVLFVKPLVYWTRFFIIATAFSRPQIDAIGSRIRDLAERKYGKVPSGDSKPNSWTLLDFGDVVIHIFLPQQREFYNLEEFYANATPIELPFENQPPFRP